MFGKLKFACDIEFILKCLNDIPYISPSLFWKVSINHTKREHLKYYTRTRIPFDFLQTNLFFKIFSADGSDDGVGICGFLLTGISWLLVLVTLPFSLCVCFKVIILLSTINNQTIYKIRARGLKTYSLISKYTGGARIWKGCYISTWSSTCRGIQRAR